ncbi:hypothetical protein SUGI_1094250, partial [Cryptomeria japonica]
RLSFAQGNVLVSTHLLLKAIFCAGQRSSFHTLTAQVWDILITKDDLKIVEQQSILYYHHA